MPDQNASIAVPLSFLAMIGSATDSDVASRAAYVLKLVSLETYGDTRSREIGA